MGDCVRISKLRKIFKKGYIPNWSEEIFTVAKLLKTVPIWYIIKDQADVELKGSFYEEELQKIIKVNPLYKIEAILEERKKKNQSQVFVKWSGYPSSFNSWINKSDIRKYKD